MLSLKQTSLLLFHKDNHSFFSTIDVNNRFFQKELMNLFRCKYCVKIYAKQQGRL